MLRRIFLFLLLTLISICITAPAVLWDSALRDQTRNVIGLTNTGGSIWRGEGILALRDPVSGAMRPITQLSWRFLPARLLSARITWEFSAGGLAPFTLSLAPAGLSTQGLRINIPAAFALERIPNVIGHAGWHGDIAIAVPGLECTWQLHCTGNAQLIWLGAAADIFQGKHLGDYYLDAEATGDATRFTWRTQGGEARIDASGSITHAGQLELAGIIEGDPLFIGRLPNIAGRWVSNDGDPGRYRFNFSGPLSGQ